MVLMTFSCIKYTAHVGTVAVKVGELRPLRKYVPTVTGSNRMIEGYFMNVDIHVKKTDTEKSTN